MQVKWDKDGYGRGMWTEADERLLSYRAVGLLMEHVNHRLTIKKLLHTFNNRISYSLECMTCNEILIDIDVDGGE